MTTAKDIIRRKCRHFHGCQWCGALLPAEIFVLLDAGAVAVHPEEEQLARQMKEEGHSIPLWFYFTPPKDLLPC